MPMWASRAAEPAYRYAIYAPFRGLGAQALPFHMPSQGHQPLCGDVDVRVGLIAV